MSNAITAHTAATSVVTQNCVRCAECLVDGYQLCERLFSKQAHIRGKKAENRPHYELGDLVIGDVIDLPVSPQLVGDLAQKGGRLLGKRCDRLAGVQPLRVLEQGAENGQCREGMTFNRLIGSDIF